MPIVRKDLHGKIIGIPSGSVILYDPRTAKDLRIALSVDITDRCKMPKKYSIKTVRLDFAKISHGKIALITKCYRPKSDKGPCASYALWSLRKKNYDATFRNWANSFGLTPEKLHTLILGYAKKVK